MVQSQREIHQQNRAVQSSPLKILIGEQKDPDPMETQIQGGPKWLRLKHPNHHRTNWTHSFWPSRSLSAARMPSLYVMRCADYHLAKTKAKLNTPDRLDISDMSYTS
jgi:hypothetical protein